MLLETGLLGCTLLGVAIGGWSIYWTKCKAGMGRSVLGRWIFLLTVFVLGLLAVPAAYFQAQALTPMGLCLGLLVAAMLWDLPGVAGTAESERRGLDQEHPATVVGDERRDDTSRAA